jgi:hypothetical protein
VIAIFTSRSHSIARDVEKATAHFLRNANSSWSFASAFSGSIEAFGFVNPIIVDEDKTIRADTGGLRLPRA